MIISANKWEHDVQGYLNICNITDSTPRKQIRDFAAGVNDLGLWNSMVCWPLRSTQNAGTGTTAYSLGGLGTFDGTLTNGPTWGTDGVNFADNTTQHIATSFIPDTANNFLIWSAFQSNLELTQPNAICASRVSGISYFTCFQNTNGSAMAVLWGTPTTAFANTPAITNGTYNTAAFRFDVLAATPNSGITLNTNAEATANATAPFGTPTPALCIGNESPINSRSLNGNLPFLAYIRANSINNVALRDLYRATLGTGLGLP